jgi:ABC-type transport system substrate-binding protein
MRTAGGFRAACLALGLALLAASCSQPPQDAGRSGVRGGTLRVLSNRSLTGLSGLDTAGYALLARAYARTLYGYNLAGPPEQKTVPVPDIATGYRRSADQRTYTFTLRARVRYAPPVNREVTAGTSSPPSSGSTTRPSPHPDRCTRTSSPGPGGLGPARPTASPG